MKDKFNLQEKYALNPNYYLKHDKTRSIIGTILNPEYGRYAAIKCSDNFFSFQHPFMAAILSYFNGKHTLEIQLQIMEQELGISPQEVLEITQLFLENERILMRKVGDVDVYIPENFIIPYNDSFPIKKTDADDFYFETLDLKTRRLNIPNNFTIMVNTKCITDCVYCYADRRPVHSELAIERIQELIKEAKDLNMSSVDVLGGEFFLYSEWKKLLKSLLGDGFHPYISTKIPLDKEQVQSLKEAGLQYIQVSFDSFNDNELCGLLKVRSGYKEKMIKTIEYLNQANIKIITHTILTSQNSDEKNIEKLLDYLSGIENVHSIRFTPVGYTRYKSVGNFTALKPSKKNLLKIEALIEKYREKDTKKRYILMEEDFFIQNEADLEKQWKAFNRRSICTGNLRGFFVLPDGKVTFCEQMYWDESCILGNLTKQSIMEMWTSPRAVNFMDNKKKVQTEKSFCYLCEDYDECHNGRGVCWKLVVENYGSENWFYPDPRCPHAPPARKELYY